MGASFGEGITGYVPGGFNSDDERVAFCRQFSGFGLSHRFRAVIGGRVAEFAYKKGEVETSWLNDEEADVVIAAARRVGGSASYTLIGDCFYPDTQILLPGFRGRGEISLKAPDDHPFNGYFVGALRGAIEWSERRLAEMRDEGSDERHIEFLDGLLRDFMTCREHRLIFMFGY